MVPLKWEVADGSPNKFSRVAEAKQEFFTTVQAMSFSGKLVKNQTEVNSIGLYL